MTIFTSRRNPEWILAGSPELCKAFATHGLDDFLNSSLHVSRHSLLVVAPAECEAQDRYTPLISNVRIYLALVQISRRPLFFWRRGFRLGSEHCIPECGRSMVFESEASEGKLCLVNTTKQLHSSNRDGSGGEALEPKHGASS